MRGFPLQTVAMEQPGPGNERVWFILMGHLTAEGALKPMPSQASNYRVQSDGSGASIDTDHLAVTNMLCGFLALDYARYTVFATQQ